MSAARLELSLVDGLPSGRGHRRARVKSSHLIDIGRHTKLVFFLSSKSNRSTMATSTTFVAAALGAGYDLETLEQLLESRARALRTDAHSDATQPATTALASATSTTAQSTSPSGAPQRAQVVEEGGLRAFLVARQQADAERDALDRRSQAALAQLHEVAQQALATRGHAVDRYGEALLEHAHEEGLVALERSPQVQQIVQRRIDECARALTVEHAQEMVEMQRVVDRRLHEVGSLLDDLHERSARADTLAAEASAALAAMEERAAVQQRSTSTRGVARAAPPPRRRAPEGRTPGGAGEQRRESPPRRDRAPPSSARSSNSGSEASAAAVHGDIREEMRRPTARRSSIARDAARQASSATGVHAERAASPQRRISRSRGPRPPPSAERVTLRAAPPLGGAARATTITMGAPTAMSSLVSRGAGAMDSTFTITVAGEGPLGFELIADAATCHGVISGACSPSGAIEREHPLTVMDGDRLAAINGEECVTMRGFEGDGDGRIDPIELERALGAEGSVLREVWVRHSGGEGSKSDAEIIEAMLEEFNANGDGSVSNEAIPAFRQLMLNTVVQKISASERPITLTFVRKAAQQKGVTTLPTTTTTTSVMSDDLPDPASRGGPPTMSRRPSQERRAEMLTAAQTLGDSARAPPRASAEVPPKPPSDTPVSILLCTVTFHANLAHSLTRSP